MATRPYDAPQPEPPSLMRSSQLESRIVVGGFVLAAIVAVALAVGAVLGPHAVGRAALPGMTAADGGGSRGLLVTSVQTGSAAAKEVVVGDRIVSINGAGTGTLAAARALLRERTANVVDIQVEHNHSIHHVILTRSGEKPDEPQDSRRRR